MNGLTKSLRVGITVSTVTVLLAGCQWVETIKNTLPWVGQDPQFDVNIDDNKETSVEHLKYASPVAYPLQLQCLDNSGAWVNLKVSSILTNANNVLNNINTDGAADHPVYVHDFGVPPTSVCKQRKVPSTLRTTTLYKYTKSNLYYTYRVMDGNGTAQPAFTDAEWACFNNNPSPDFWDRTATCNTDPNAAFEILARDQISRAVVQNNTNINFNFGAFDRDLYTCQFDTYIDGVLYKSIAGQTSNNWWKSYAWGTSHTWELRNKHCWYVRTQCPTYAMDCKAYTGSIGSKILKIAGAAAYRAYAEAGTFSISNSGAVSVVQTKSFY